MTIRQNKDFEGMSEIAHIVADVLLKMKEFARPGMSTKELDEYGNQILISQGAVSAPKSEYNFPGYNCISVNHVAAHGIPSTKVILKEGDLVNIDVSATKNNYFGDNGSSFVLGKDINQLSYLVETSKEILLNAIALVKDGMRIRDIGKYVEHSARDKGLFTIKNLCGHGIGRKLHERPHEIPNYYDIHNNEVFKAGQAVAIETFISTKARFVYEQLDGWTMMPPDNSFVAQHEHTLIVTDKDPIILTHGNGIS
ncbi:MAG: type I methionyl aminopeptidase [Hyphomicrobiales bacterium]